jgi:hypothetical protein
MGGSSSTSPELDPLVSNGLASPTCAWGTGAGGLSRSSRRNCETSGFVAASAPTGDYGVDVHIDTGVPGLSTGWLLATVQELFVTPIWTALVWAVHALIVMLEWCFTIDLLDSPSVGVGVARALRRAQSTFTEPWLATALAIAAVLAAYNGLIRRRVAETVGQALLILVMMAGGIWVTLDPADTVGALGSWANQAGLGTLAVSASGSPARGAQALADSMGAVFSAAVEVPWCYLEFGDVGWCRNPARLDPRLRVAAQAIAAGELVFARCEHRTAVFGLCSAPGSPQVRALEHSAQLLREARSNGAIFLALPANGPQRNSIDDHESLLRALCQSEQATACRGATSAQAEFRTNRGTWPRVAGLLLIVAGVLGMLLLLGFLAMRLLASALISLLYLMLAPAAVLAPALGDGGRAIFRRWAIQLLGAVVSKLLFAFLLGAVLTVLSVLQSLEALGWWTQWLLMTAFWWGAFTHRHQALQLAGGDRGDGRVQQRRTLGRRASEALVTPRKLAGGVRAAKQRREQRNVDRALIEGQRQTPAPGPSMTRRTKGDDLTIAAPPHGDGASGDGRPSADQQAVRMLQAEHRDAREVTGGEPEIEGRLSAMRAQLARLGEQRDAAVAAGDTRRSVQLAHRAARVAGALERERAGIDAARQTFGAGARARARGFGAELLADRQRFLDAQAALPPSSQRRGGDDRQHRDYAALAGVAGYGRREYDSLQAREKRAARLEIDRQLATRAVPGREWTAAGAGGPQGGGEPGGARPVRRAQADRVRAARDPNQPIPRDGAGAPRRHRPDPSSESSVMADIRAVAERRKRQLGRGRP